MQLSLRAKKSRQRLGMRGENTAAKYLELEGMRILARNFKCRAGELDIVALDGNELVFVEVKSLRFRSGFTPAGNLSMHQRRRNRNAARLYYKLISSPPLLSRFDLVELVFRNNILISLHHTENYLLPIPPAPPLAE